MSHNAQNLAVPELRWLGLLPTDIRKMNIPSHCLTSLNKYDRKKIESLLERPYLMKHWKWRRELDVISNIGQKAGIQALFEINHEFLSREYLPIKLRSGLWI